MNFFRASFLIFFFYPLLSFSEPVASENLSLVQSSNSSLSRLGWGALSARLRMGGTLDVNQLVSLQDQWKKIYTPENLRTLSWAIAQGMNPSSLNDLNSSEPKISVLSDAILSKKSGPFSWDQPNHYPLLNSQNSIDQAILNQLESKGALTENIFSFADFLKDAAATTYVQSNPFILPPSNQWMHSPTVLGIELKVDIGTLQDGVTSNTTISGGSGQNHYDIRNHLRALRTEWSSLEGLSREPALKLTFPHLASELEMGKNDCLLAKLPALGRTQHNSALD